MDVAVLAILRSSHYVMIAVGFSLVFGVCRSLNLMHGTYVMLGAYLTYGMTRTLYGLGIRGPYASIGGTLVAACIVGVAAALFFQSLRLTHRTGLYHVLAITAAGNVLVSGVLAWFYGTEGFNVSPILDRTVSIAGVTVPRGDLLIPAAATLCLGALWYWLHHSRSGIALRAVADNREAARLAGIDPDRVLASAVGIAAAMAAIAGALRAPGQTLTPNMWIHPLLISFAAVVFGGRNSLRGAVAGAAVLGIVETLTAWFWNEAVAQFAAFGAVVIGLTLFPGGLIALPDEERL